MSTCFVTVDRNDGNNNESIYISVVVPADHPTRAVKIADVIHEEVQKAMVLGTEAEDLGMVIRHIVEITPEVWMIGLVGNLRSDVWCYVVRWHF